MIGSVLRNIEKIGVSVVIVCYNSENRILPTLSHLSKQRGIDFPWDIVLVDNRSTDGTVIKATEFWKATNILAKLTVVPEPNKGTMFARLKGIQSANYRYLLFCDDDNWLNETYIKDAFDVICQSEGIAAVGGQGEMVFEENFLPPPWAKLNGRSYGTGPQGIQDGDTTFHKGCLYTAGAILDRVWLDKLYRMGFQSSLKGRDGLSLVAGEDTELTYALKLVGGKLYFSSKLIFKHFMPSARMDWVYLQRLWKSFGYSDYLLYPYKLKMKGLSTPGRWSQMMKQVLSIIKYAGISSIYLFGEGNNYVLQLQRSLGKFSAMLNAYSLFVKNERMAAMLSSQRSPSREI